MTQYCRTVGDREKYTPKRVLGFDFLEHEDFEYIDDSLVENNESRAFPKRVCGVRSFGKIKANSYQFWGAVCHLLHGRHVLD